VGYPTESIAKGVPFNPLFTFECGQAFRWKRLSQTSEDWLGIILGNLVRVKGDSLRVLGRAEQDASRTDAFDLRKYFSLEHDLDQILSSLPKDPFLISAVKEYYGLRILRQDPWECIISFLCSINCNIPSIKLKIENLCRRFGTRIESGVMDGEYYSFPEANSLAGAEKRELLSCKLGFRWKYVRYVSKKVAKGELKLGSLSRSSYHTACDELISEASDKTLGVGPKVADCVCLFSLGMLEAFPIDIWMIRCLMSQYRDLIGFCSKKVPNQLPPRRYQKWAEIMRSHFGSSAGYAQQYLYMKMRNSWRVHSK